MEIAKASYDLFESLYKWERPVRGAGVAVCDFTLGLEQLSLDIGNGPDKHDKFDKLESAVDGIRKKYGNKSVQRARILQDKKLAGTEIKGDPFGKNL